MKKFRYKHLIMSLIATGIGVFFLFELQGINTNKNWWFGFMVFAFISGALNLLVFFTKEKDEIK